MSQIVCRTTVWKMAERRQQRRRGMHRGEPATSHGTVLRDVGRIRLVAGVLYKQPARQPVIVLGHPKKARVRHRQMREDKLVDGSLDLAVLALALFGYDGGGALTHDMQAIHRGFRHARGALKPRDSLNF